MPGPSIKIESNDRPFTDLKAQIKDARADVKELRKELDAARREKREAAPGTGEKLKAAEKGLAGLTRTMKSRGKLLQAQEAGNLRNTALETFKQTRFGQTLDALQVRGNEFMKSPAGKVVGSALVAVAAAKVTLEALKVGAQIIDPYSESLRQQRASTGISLSSNSLIDPGERFRLKSDLQLAERAQTVGRFQSVAEGIKKIPLIGSTVGGALGKGIDAADYLQGRATGTDFAASADRRNAEAIRATGANLSPKGRELMAETAGLRVMKEKFGSGISGDVAWGGRKILDSLGLKSNEYEQAKNAKIQETGGKFNALTADGFRMVEEMDFQGASKAFRNADIELLGEAKVKYDESRGIQTWREPMSVWMSMDSARHSVRNYAAGYAQGAAVRLGG